MFQPSSGIDDTENCFFPPTLVTNVQSTSALVQEEIFGPLCVIREYTTIDDAVEYVNSHPCPLACYVFTHNDEVKGELTQSIRCGGMGINCVNLHTCVAALPFGGVGASGTGFVNLFASLSLSRLLPFIWLLLLSSSTHLVFHFWSMRYQ